MKLKKYILSLAATFITAAVVMGSFTACSSEDGVMAEELPGGVAAAGPALVYSVSIPATLGDESTTRAVSYNGTTGVLESTFRTTDNIFVENVTKGLFARDNEYSDLYLHADANAKTANLVGGLAFYGDSHYNEVEVNDVLLLSYNRGNGYFYDNHRENPDGTDGQKGTLTGLSDYDFATAEVKITAIDGAGTAESPYTLTTSNAAFTNLQSMFKLTFTGMPDNFIDEPFDNGINSITIRSAKNKLVYYYTTIDNFKSFKITLGGGGSNDPRRGIARKENGAGNVVYAALRFLPLGEGETDEITFTMECTDGKTYIAKKTSPVGGFQNGKYYTATIEAYPETVDLTSLTEDYTARDGQVLTGELSGHQLQIDDRATVTLSGVTVTAPENENYDAILCLGDATIVLADETTNTVSVSVANYGVGIYFPENKTLTIRGNGGLTATGGLASAGIGSWFKGCGNIIIEGGTIAAYGGLGAAGIGSGNKSNCGNIIIEGGTVTAQGGARAAGIGSGINASCGNISITGGSVNATGGNYAAGIGTGEDGSCGDITIGGTDAGTDAGTVTGTATGGENSPSDIGPGKNGSCGTVSVAGGTISYVPDANVPCTFNFTFKKNGVNVMVWTNEIVVSGSASATITNNGNSIENGSSVTVDLKAMRSGTLTFTASCKNFTAGFTDAGTFTCTLENVRIAKNETNTYDVVMQWAHD